jgi:hydroxymethylpyrimidine pyrophosphatase-like HAD family hydrolase
VRYLALAADYDGTLATNGEISAIAISAIERLRMSGRRVILVTGRRLEDLLGVCRRIDIFDYAVAENGALIYTPRTRAETLLGKPVPMEFTKRLTSMGVAYEAGRIIISTWVPNHTSVLQAIQDTGLELTITFNRGAVMVLPAGINKATGLDYALRMLGLSFHEVVGIGDAGNDHSFLERCECAVAVGNAELPIRQLAAFTTQGTDGQGVAELINELIADDLASRGGRLQRNLITVGARSDGSEVTISPYGVNVLIAGPSGSGKSTLTTSIVERLIRQNYQVCIVDPEGDYGTLADVFTLGNENHAVSVNEVLSILEDPKNNLNINLLGIHLTHRPEFFGQLFPSLRTLRTRTGRPHWIVLDEAHHLLPIEWGHLPEALPHQLGETILVTVHPDHLPPLILSLVDVVIAVGPSPEKTLRDFCNASGHEFLWSEGLSYKPGWAVLWSLRTDQPPVSMRIIPPAADRVRHRRKYAEGDLRNKSFYFRGPANRQNLKAPNLTTFSLLSEGIDEDTWIFHLRRGDYSRWFREAIKDRYLADQTERIEGRSNLQPEETRKLIRNLIEARFTLQE